MKNREIVLVWIPTVILVIVPLCSLLAGLLRGPIGERMMFEVSAISNRDHHVNASTSEIVFGNYWIGSWGMAIQLHLDDMQYYQITCNRYLNIFPDVLHDSIPMDPSYPVTK